MAVQLFLSCVSNEFGAEREALRRALTRPNVEVKIQEDFKALGGDTLAKLEDYIRQCQAVVHLVGDMAGSAPNAYVVSELLARRPDLKTRLPPLGAAVDAGAAISYTQWEAWLALYFRKDLVIAEPAPGPGQDAASPALAQSKVAQAEHLDRLREVGRYPEVRFTDRNDLVAQIFASAVIDALVKAASIPVRQPRNVPFASLGPLFIGRDAALDALRAALEGGAGAAVVGRAVHGLGGIGKTRLAIEYALRHEADYSALLFVRAADPATLNASLAALAGAEVLDLREQEAREDEVKIRAVLRWFEAHPTWLMILDNVDDEQAIAAVSALMARLKGGRVIVTARAADFPAHIQTLELGALDLEPATRFLIDRTQNRRAAAADDAVQARSLAEELGGLALGLEQAGAYIARQRIGFAGYLALWRQKRESVLDWFDKTLMSYNHDVGLAATWAASVEKLTPDSRRLLYRLAFLAPDPIPDALIDVAVPGSAAGAGAREALVGLYAYSLVSSATGEDGASRGFVIHRLVQDFVRRAMSGEQRRETLNEALGWMNAAFVGVPDDVRSWPVLDPLAPHALAVASQAHDGEILTPTGRLFGRLATLSYGKARYAEAEQLYRRGLAIDLASFGPDHPEVAADLHNLAELLRVTNRNNAAEPLLRSAMAIHEQKLGKNHPRVAADLNSLATLLQQTNRLGEAEQMFRRALAIDEASFGPRHPDVARDLNNLAMLLRATNRVEEAAPYSRRALAILEAANGSNHPSVAIGLDNLAGMLRDANRFDEAEPLHRRALAIVEANYGPDHPEVATVLTNLAGLLQRTGRFAEAEPLFRRALAIDEATFGPAHPNVAGSLNNVASALRAVHRLDEAEPLLRRALAIQEASYAPDHPEVAGGLNNLAVLLLDRNCLDEAEPLFRRALAIREKSLGADHPSTIRTRSGLAMAMAARRGSADSGRGAKGLIRRLFGRR